MFPNEEESKKESDKVCASIFKRAREEVIANPLALCIKSCNIVLNNDK